MKASAPFFKLVVAVYLWWRAMIFNGSTWKSLTTKSTLDTNQLTISMCRHLMHKSSALNLGSKTPRCLLTGSLIGHPRTSGTSSLAKTLTTKETIYNPPPHKVKASSPSPSSVPRPRPHPHSPHPHPNNQTSTPYLFGTSWIAKNISS